MNIHKSMKYICTDHMGPNIWMDLMCEVPALWTVLRNLLLSNGGEVVNVLGLCM